MKFTEITTGWLDFLLLIVIVGTVYTVTGPSTIQEADFAEFASLAAVRGVAHPPGYPLLLWFLSCVAPFLPKAAYIGGLTLVSIFFGVLTACVSYLTMLRLTADRLVSAISVLFFLLATSIWRSFTSIEPFGLNLLLVSLVCFFQNELIFYRIKQDAVAPAKCIFALGFMFALGFCNHHTLVFLGPSVFLVMFLGARTYPIGQMLMRFIVGFVVGLFPLGYFWIADTQALYSWGSLTTISNVVTHLFRSEYGTFQLASGNTDVYVSGAARFYLSLYRELTIPGLAFCLSGLFALFYRNESFSHRTVLGCSLISFLGAGPLYFAVAKTGNDEIGRLIIDRFIALPCFLLLPFFALGLNSLTWRPKFKNVVLVAGVVTVFWTGFQNLDGAERKSHTFSDLHVKNIFQSLDGTGLLILSGDVDFNVAIYGQVVQKLRPEVIIIQPDLWSLSWYREKIANVTHLEVSPDFAAFAETALRQNQRLYINEAATEYITETAFQTQQRGILQEVLLLNAKQLGSEALFTQNEAIFNEYDLPTPEQMRHFDPWERYMLHSYYWSWYVVCNPKVSSLQPSSLKQCEQYLKYFAFPLTKITSVPSQSK